MNEKEEGRDKSEYLFLCDVQLVSVGDTDHLLHNVEAGNALGDRMLHL